MLVIDNLVTGVREFVNTKATFNEMDIRNPKLSDVLCEHKIEYMFHEAALTMVPMSMECPQYDCDVNLMGLINVLNACRPCKVKKILMPSSAAVYGDNTHLPLTEDQIGVPSSFYGLTKLTAEGYLRIYEAAFGLRYICYRYSNVYGPRQGDGGEGGVISIFGRLASKGKNFTIFGDGEQTRDFVYVHDVVEANIQGMLHEDVTGIFNVSTNTGVTVNALLEHFRRLSGKDISVTYEPERVGDIRHSCLCNEKAEKLLKFKATMELSKGLGLTYDYFQAVKKD